MCGVTVNAYYLDEHRDGSDGDAFAAAMLDAGMEAIRICTEAYGSYPYNELDIVEGYFWYAGMENAGYVQISSNMAGFMGYGDGRSVDIVVVHEVAHQWFPFIIGNDQYTDSWLDEGFATFTTLLFKRSFMTDVAFANQLDFEPPPKHINLPLEHYVGDHAPIIYNGGAMFLWRIMTEMGEDTFYEMTRAYYSAFSFKEVKTSDFINLLREWSSGVNVENIISAYISEP